MLIWELFDLKTAMDQGCIATGTDGPVQVSIATEGGSGAQAPAGFTATCFLYHKKNSGPIWQTAFGAVRLDTLTWGLKKTEVHGQVAPSRLGCNAVSLVHRSRGTTSHRAESSL